MAAPSLAPQDHDAHSLLEFRAVGLPLERVGCAVFERANSECLLSMIRQAFGGLGLGLGPSTPVSDVMKTKDEIDRALSDVVQRCKQPFEIRKDQLSSCFTGEPPHALAVSGKIRRREAIRRHATNQTTSASGPIDNELGVTL